jgi:L-2,4-diaminobutyrate decarboxylase
LLAIRRLADTWSERSDMEIMHEPETGILCFRVTPKGVPRQDLNALQKQLYRQIMSSGERSISITNIDGMTTLRLVVVSPHTKYEDLLETITVLQQMAGLIGSYKGSLP